MYDRCRSTGRDADPDAASAPENPADVQPDRPTLDRRRAAEAYRAEAAHWDHIAQRMSLIPDREYLLSIAGELRAKAAALEAAAAASPLRDGEPVTGDAPLASDGESKGD